MHSPFTPDNSIAFPKMTEVEGHEDHPKQPAITDDGGFIWPGDEGTKRKAVPGVFVVEKYLTPTTIGEPLGKDDDDHDHDEDSHDDGDSEEEDGSTPTSRSLKRDSQDYTHQVTLSVGGLLLAAGGFLLGN